LDTKDASGSTLAGETVADRDSNRLSLDGEPELLTTTRGASSAHERDRRQAVAGLVASEGDWSISGSGEG
jgi:hypothetical protein